MGSLHEGDTLPFTRNMIKSDDPAVQMQQHAVQGRKDEAEEEEGTVLRVAKFWNVFEGPPEVQGPGTRRYVYGCVLTTMYLIGAFALIAFYLKIDDGRPSRIRQEYVSSIKATDGSMNGFICTCDLPAQIQSYVGNDTRNKSSFHRCYNPNEVRGEVNVLQYGVDIQKDVSDLIRDINKKNPLNRTFADGYHLLWESYELTPAQADIDPFSTSSPLAALTKQVDDKGYVGGEGFISLSDLASLSFFSVPQGFISATVDYNCTSCDRCDQLWKLYDFGQATSINYNASDIDDKDEGWIFCGEDASSPRTSGGQECQGFCRFFRPQHRPWGISMYTFANDYFDTLSSTEEAAKAVYFVFHPRLLYANISRYSSSNSYNLTSLEVDRSGTVWAKLLDWYGSIATCGFDNSTLICNGTSICEFAPGFSSTLLNSESLNVACMNYATDVKFKINRSECENIVNELGLEFRVNKANGSVIDSLCGDFVCEKAPSTRITWSNFKLDGENALNRLVYLPAILTTYIPGICTNNYTDVLLLYENQGEKEEKLLSIHEMNCSSGNSVGCWLTGRYKNMTDLSTEPWKTYTFSPEEEDAAKTMFACYQFGKKSYHSWMFDLWGTVSGTVGSWLLMLSGVFWALTKLKPRYFHPSNLASVFCAHPPSSDRKALDSPEGQQSGSWQRSFNLEEQQPR